MSRSLTDTPHHLERDACGIGFVASTRRRAVARSARPRARGADAGCGTGAPSPPTTAPGDGAGVLLPLPGRSLPRASGWQWSSRAASAPGRRWRRHASPRASASAHGAASRSTPTRSARRRARARRGSSRRCSRRARAWTRSCALSAPAGGSTAATTSTSPRSRSGRSSTRRSAPPTSSPPSTPTCADPALAGAVRRLPPALLDEHGAVVGARAAVPAALPQRRDQRDPRQRELDARPHGRARPRPFRGRAAPRRDELGLRDARQRARAARPRRPRRRHALAMLIPPAWQDDPELPDDVRSFYRFHAGLVEPWDGPAGIVFSDGAIVGAGLDRNGLRPLRYTVAGDLVCCGSEAGLFDLPDGHGAARAARPGRDARRRPRRAASARTRAQARARRARAVRRAGSAPWRRQGSAGEPVAPPEEEHRRAARAVRLHARGAVGDRPPVRCSAGTSRPRRWATTRRCRS